MNSWLLVSCWVLLCVAEFSSADDDEGKCTKMEGRADLSMNTLRKHLLCNYDSNSAPVNSSDGNRVGIRANLIRYRVDYKQSEEWKTVDTYNSLENSPNWFKMTTYLFLDWEDPRLKWNASDYNNRTRVFFDTREIWLPDVDSAGHYNSIYVQSDGLVRYFFWTEMNGNCWPIYYSWGDQRECVLSFRIHDDEAKLEQLDTHSYDYLRTNAPTWSVMSGKRVFPLKEGEKNDKFEEIHKEKPWKYGPGYFETKVVIQRNFGVQDASIFSPAVILVILLISTTWIPAQNVSRVAMLSVIIVVEVFMFHESCRSMPYLPEKTVDIVRLYEELIICTGVAVLEWLIAYNVATQRSTIAEKIETHMIIPRPSMFVLLKTVFVVSEKGSKSIETAALLDRITFLVLTVLSFILLVLSSRPPLVLIGHDDLHKV